MFSPPPTTIVQSSSHILITIARDWECVCVHNRLALDINRIKYWICGGMCMIVYIFETRKCSTYIYFIGLYFDAEPWRWASATILHSHMYMTYSPTNLTLQLSTECMYELIPTGARTTYIQNKSRHPFQPRALSPNALVLVLTILICTRHRAMWRERQTRTSTRMYLI